jgi:hypothetical protein
MTFVRIAAYHLQQLRAGHDKPPTGQLKLAERCSVDSGLDSPTSDVGICDHDEGERILQELKVFQFVN